MLEITEEQYQEWKNAVLCAQSSNSYGLKIFKDKYPDLYRHMMSMLNKRTKISNTLKAFMSVCPFVYWGDLTFNEEEDIKELGAKRKQVRRFLDKFFKVYLYVEELGEEGERWHVHYLGLLKEGVKYDEMRSHWHSFIQIECLYKYYEVKKKIKYVTKYAVKQVPRIHMNTRAIQLCKDYKRHKRWLNLGFNCFKTQYFNAISDLLDLPF